MEREANESRTHAMPIPGKGAKNEWTWRDEGLTIRVLIAVDVCFWNREG